MFTNNFGGFLTKDNPFVKSLFDNSSTIHGYVPPVGLTDMVFENGDNMVYENNDEMVYE